MLGVTTCTAKEGACGSRELSSTGQAGSTGLPPVRIVISYRRQDTPGGAGRLRESLAAHFGRENVFLDIDAIPPGVDWLAAIEETLSGCDVLLPVIGLHWLTAADDSGRRRLDDPDDVLRFEIETALKAQLRLIPVQLHGARMPSADQLPGSLAGLTRRQSIRIDDDDWPHDVQKLIRELEKIQREKAEAVPVQVAEREAAPEETEHQEAERVRREATAAAQREFAEPRPVEPRTAGHGQETKQRAALPETYQALALRSFRALGPLRVALIFAAAGLLLFLGTRGTPAYTTLGESPLNRLGTLTIGAGVVVAVALAATRPLFSWGASFVVALALQEAFGASATVFVEASRDGEFIRSRHAYVIGAAVLMALAACAAAATIRHNVGRQRYGWSLGVPLVVASVGAATAFTPLFLSPLTANAQGNAEGLFYENPWYRLEPIGIATASAFAVLLVYRTAPRIAAGWLAGTAVNSLLYAAGLAAFASATFGGLGNEIRPSGLALFGTAALLALASALVLERRVWNGGAD